MFILDYADSNFSFLNLCSREAPPGEVLTRISELLAVRAKCRDAKLYEEADMIRAKVGEMGATVQDTSKGIILEWKK